MSFRSGHGLHRFPVVAFLLLGAWIVGAAPAPIPSVADTALYRSLILPDVKMPPRLYTPEMIARLKKKENPLGLLPPTGDAGLGQRIAEAIPPERWAELIPPYAAFTMAAGADNTPRGACPFCGQTYKRPTMTVEELISTPFQVKAGCCGAVVYEREADMPDGYPAKPNRTVTIPHLDGTDYAYRFHVPAGSENADFGFDSGRGNWFCSASEVWLARVGLLHLEPTKSVVKALAARAFLANDERAYCALAAIYARLAEVYPGWPLVDSQKVANGIARARDQKGYLTTGEYRATSVPREFAKPEWFASRYYNLDKMNVASSWQDGVLAQQANLLDLFDLIRDHPAVAAYSQERFGAADAWEKRVRTGVVAEAHFIARWSTTQLRGGNTMVGWIKGALKIGPVMQDAFFVRTAAAMVDRAVQNQFFGDGMSVEGAFNYGGMMAGAIDLMPVLREFFGVDLVGTFPYAATVRQLGATPVRTVWGVESMHNDQHAWFFTGCGQGWKIPPYKEPAYGNEAAQCFPEYGLAVLRAGAPGSRMEVMLNFLSALGHGHQAQLNLQLFFEGVQTMPDIGYGCVSADITKAPWPDIQYPFAKLPFPPGVDFWWAWFGHYACISETHNIALVDGQHTEYPRYGPVTFQRFLGLDRLNRPGAIAQFAEADARGMFSLRPAETGVDMFNRQIAAVTLPSGRPLLLDFHRVRGGRRHDLIWHAPSAGPAATMKTSLGPSEPIPGQTLYDYFKREIPGFTRDIPAGQGIRNFKRLGRWPMPDDTWKIAWEIRPKLFESVTPEGKKVYQPWSNVLRDVDLDLWGSVVGSPAVRAELLEARAPWPSKIREYVDGKEYTGSIVALEDAFHFLFETRIAAENGLYSAYVHALEPRLTDQPPAIRQTRTLAGRPGGDPTGVGLCIDLQPAPGLATGSAPTLYAASTLTGGAFASDGFELAGRFGLVLPQDNTLCVYDGTRVQAGQLAGTVDPTWTLKLLGVAGDLTGTPEQSALFVASDRPLPTDRTLVGRMITVQHRISPLHTSGYTIAGVAAWGNNTYRLDLAGNPPFIMHRMSVRSIALDNPRLMQSDYLFMKGQNLDGLYTGRRVRFPRFGFDSAMKLQGGGWHVYGFEVLEPLPAEPKVEVGEPFIVYQIQPGDDVIIPSHLAVKGTPVPAGLKLEVEATGPCRIVIPGGWATAVQLADDARELPFAGGDMGKDLATVVLGRDSLPDGRQTLLLKR